MNIPKITPHKESVIMLSLLVASLMLFSLAAADVPKLINLQGKLTDASKNPLTGTYNIFNYLTFITAAALVSIPKMNKLGREILSGGMGD